MMVGAMIAAFQHRPKRFDAVGMGLTPDIFSCTMINNLAVADASVGLGVVGINLSTIRRDFSDEPMQDVPIGVLDGPRRYPVSLAVLGTDLSANKLTADRQRGIAIRCSILSASCAKVWFIALIDEATGYQYERETDALQIKLRTFIATELRE